MKTLVDEEETNNEKDAFEKKTNYEHGTEGYVDDRNMKRNILLNNIFEAMTGKRKKHVMHHPKMHNDPVLRRIGEMIQIDELEGVKKEETTKSDIKFCNHEGCSSKAHAISGFQTCYKHMSKERKQCGTKCLKCNSALARKAGLCYKCGPRKQGRGFSWRCTNLCGRYVRKEGSACNVCHHRGHVNCVKCKRNRSQFQGHLCYQCSDISARKCVNCNENKQRSSKTGLCRRCSQKDKGKNC